MKSPNEVKLEELKNIPRNIVFQLGDLYQLNPMFRQRTNDEAIDFVQKLLSQSLDRLQASIVESLPEPKALKDYDVMGFEDHYDRGKVNGFNQALKEVLDLLTKSQ